VVFRHAAKVVGCDEGGGDASDGRYIVETAATGEQLKLRWHNVVALHGFNPYVGEFG
jgi:hypothetical protein